ncbi:hypothetical protein MAIT1_00926 [Magnetofaba australis IT-1]|uniref:Peptidase M43 pregnancy-associated plasma-A domain-containing protein n=1 Tax=Magnetofaba australis IT-1 TaxID=1434232 RepID=A0A1Y2K2J6_9PROT|nr:hypothetical protein MAIT1_00926 [Magnetofaba australis IT-1]
MTGYFVDSAVSGLTYATPSQGTSTTGSDGSFSYQSGETVTFSLGNLTLGSATGASSITPLTLAGVTDAGNTTALNMLRLLQTLDSDDNADNGITITQTMRDQASSLGGVSISDSNFASDSALTSFLSNVKGSSSLVSSLSALQHYNGANGAGAASTNSNLSVSALGVNESSFLLSSNVVSYLLLLNGPSVGSSGVSVSSVTSPSSGTLTTVKSGATYHCGASFCTMLQPQVPTQAPLSTGLWSYNLSNSLSSSDAVYLTTRSGSVNSNATFILKPYLVSGTYTESDITAAFTRAKAIMSNHGLTLNVLDVTSIPDSQYRSVSTSYSDATTSSLISIGSKDVINVFLVDDFTNASGVLGIAPGIPGTLGLSGAGNGYMVSLSAHLIGGSLETTVMGETIVHEMGHFLGLYHTSESGGASFDPLDDTPECAKFINIVSNCLSKDGLNLMFWTAPTDLALDPGNLTSDQLTVLRYSPMAQ